MTSIVFESTATAALGSSGRRVIHTRRYKPKVANFGQSFCSSRPRRREERERAVRFICGLSGFEWPLGLTLSPVRSQCARLRPKVAERSSRRPAEFGEAPAKTGARENGTDNGATGREEAALGGEQTKANTKAATLASPLSLSFVAAPGSAAFSLVFRCFRRRPAALCSARLDRRDARGKFSPKVKVNQR